MARSSGSSDEILVALASSGTLLDGRYRIEKRLGVGGVGVVWQARHEELDRPVAIKLLQVVEEDPRALERFRQEARMAAGLRHPHVVTVHDFGRIDDGPPFLVMELCEGGSLADQLKARGALPLDQVLAVLDGITQAVDAAHLAGLVHRDLKPANVLLSNGLFKVADFGLAWVLDSEDLLGEELAGTPHYMSPEQCAGRSLDGRSDVYSLGVIAYEALTGRVPFDGPSIAAVINAHLEGHALAPSSLRADLPAEVDAAVLAALARDPAARCPTAVAFMRALSDARSAWTPTVETLVIPRPERAVRDEALDFTAAVGVMPVDGAAPIGREPELRVLGGALDAARRCQGRIVTVTGEPGRGKTTLLAAFLARVASEHSVVLCGLGRCSEQFGAAEAYLPFLEALEALSSGPQGEAVASVLRRTAPSWALQLRTTREQLATSRDAPGRSSSERMPRELVGALGAVTELGPVVLVLEDLHWADAATAELLAFLAPRLAEMPVLLIASYRPAEVESPHHPMRATLRAITRAGPEWEHLTPAPFGEDEIAACLARDLGAAPPAALVQFVLRRTEGLPLFVTGIATHLLRTGVPTREDELDALLARLEQEVPESLADLIHERLDRLDADDLRLLQAAAVEGEVFEAAVVAALLEIDEADAEEQLARLQRAHQLVQGLGELDFPCGRSSSMWTFQHVLYQNAVYALLPGRRRESWHLRVAETLLDLYGDHPESILVPLTGHFEKGRHPGRALQYCLSSADWAARVNPRDARPHLERALSYTDRLPQATRVAARTQVLVRLASHHVETAELVGDPTLYDAADEAISQALALDPESARARTVKALVRLERGDNEGAYAEVLGALARDPGQGAAWDALAYLFKNTGLWEEALEACDVAARRDDRFAHSIRRLSVLIYQDRIAEARTEGDAMVRRRPRFAHYNYWRGIVEYYGGDLAAARRWIEQGYELDAEECIAQGVMAFGCAVSGDPVRARALLESAERGAAADGTFTYWIAKVHAALGDQDAALAWLARAAELGFWDARWMRHDVALISLAGHPQFEQVLARVAAREAAFREVVARHDWRALRG